MHFINNDKLALIILTYLINSLAALILCSIIWRISFNFSLTLQDKPTAPFEFKPSPQVLQRIPPFSASHPMSLSNI